MLKPTQIPIPTLARVKDGALDRIGIYLSRNRHMRVAVLLSKGIVSPLPERLSQSLQEASIETVAWIEVQENDVESAMHTLIDLPAHVSAVIGMGGGKAMDIAKYIAFLGRLPYYAVPTSLSNGGFCSSQSSLTIGSVHAYLSHPALDLEGIRLLATALMLNGIAMEISGSSRPASWSEHLISHALDAVSKRPRLHGLQVGVASYFVSILQNENTERIAGLFDATGFWDAIAADPFSRSEWMEAVQLAPSIKQGYYTVLSTRNVLPEVDQILRHDPHLTRCFS